MSADNRLSAISPENHQPWLWFAHIFSLLFITCALFMRGSFKCRQYGHEDTVLIVGHGFYIAYWALLLVALLSSLGTSSELASEEDEIKASRLVFASRVLLCFILCHVKLSNALLVLQIFTNSLKWMKIWFYTIIGGIAAQALLGPLTISAGCSATQVLLADRGALCSNNTGRWISFTAIETVLEIILVIPVLVEVKKLHTGTKTKVFAAAAFLCRLVVWIPAWVHISLYIRFMQSNRSNIGIVSTIIAEELWAAIALVSASVPVLMKIAKQFSTPGMVMPDDSIYMQTSRSNTKKTPDQSVTANSGGNRRLSKGKELSQLPFRPDVNTDEAYTTSIVPGRRKSKSVNGSAESQVGILREVQFEVSSHHAPSYSSVAK